MAAMTMLFGVPGATLRTLHPRDAIEGTVEDAGSTWRLGSVVVAGPAPPERYIPVLEVGSSVPELRLVDQSERPFSLRAPGGTNPSIDRCGRDRSEEDGEHRDPEDHPKALAAMNVHALPPCP
jgi:hypothetical protein